MRNPITLSVVLVSLLSGCSVATPLVPTTERVVKTPQFRQVSAKALGGVRMLPSQSGKRVAPTPGGTSVTVEEPSAPDTTASEASTPAVAPTGPVTLRLSKAPEATIGLIPILGDDGRVARMLVRGGHESLDWTVTASAGSAAVRLAKVRVEFQATSTYMLPAKYEVPASAEVTPDVEASPEAAALEPLTAELTPAELAFPDTFLPGSDTTLALDLQSPLFSGFLDLYYGTATIAVTLTLVGDDDQPLRDHRDRPLVLEHTLQIL